MGQYIQGIENSRKKYIIIGVYEKEIRKVKYQIVFPRPQG